MKWLGTTKGLSSFDGTTWTTYNTSNSGLPSNIIKTVAIEENGTMWLGTWDDDGLIKFDGANWTIYNTSNSNIPDDKVNVIIVDENQTKWIGTSLGLAQFDGSNWTIYNPSNSGLSGYDITTICIDAHETKWIGAYPGGVTAFNINGFPDAINEQRLHINKANIYPNPAHDFLNVDLLSPVNISYIEIFNAQGILVKSHVLANNQNTLDLRDLNCGIYLLKIYTDNGCVVKKLIKQ